MIIKVDDQMQLKTIATQLICKHEKKIKTITFKAIKGNLTWTEKCCKNCYNKLEELSKGKSIFEEFAELKL